MLRWRDGDEVFTMRAVAVILSRGRVLVHRAFHDEFYALPGGRCEFDEPATVCVVREMREELATDVEVERLLWVVENFFGDDERYHEVGFYFLTILAEDDPLHDRDEWEGVDNETHLIFRWVDIDDPWIEQNLYPIFLRQALRAIPDGAEYVVNRERPSMLALDADEVSS
jgi:ADP-ribose pyrophosphatase YjhB (NUDIX family)